MLIKILFKSDRFFKFQNVVKLSNSFHYKLEEGLIFGGRAYNWMYFFCLQVDGPINEGTYELGGLVIGSLKFSFHIFQGSGLFNLGHFLKGERFVT